MIPVDYPLVTHTRIRRSTHRELTRPTPVPAAGAANMDVRQLLRDLAFVLHLTQKVKREMTEATEATFSTNTHA